jgi:hypothetical protein
MSETYTRKQVKRVAITPIIAGGAILAVNLGAALLKSLSRPAKEMYIANSRTSVIKPLNLNQNISLAGTTPIISSNKVLASSAEAIKVSTLLALNNSRCVVEKSETLKKKVSDLQLANCEVDARKAQSSLYQELEQNQSRLFTKGLTAACAKASVKAGFAHVDTKQSPNGSTVRVVASDAQGRSLVTEITAQNKQDRQIVSELIGVRDKSCQLIMNRFDQSLLEQGVQSLPAVRKFTGGVCETNAAIEFLRKIIAPYQHSGEQIQKNDNNRSRRVQNLNQKNLIRNKY